MTHLMQKLFAFGLFMVVLSGLIIVQVRPTAQAAVNFTMNYQGKLTNSSNVAVADGTYNMRFKLYDTIGSGDPPTGGTLLWTETRTGGNKVQVTNGIFSVMLGDIDVLTGVNFNQTLFLSVEIGGTGTPGWDGEMAPRKKVGTVPAAFLANTLEGTGKIDITNTSTNQQTINYDGSNRLTVGVASNGFTTLTAVGAGAGFNLTGGNVGIGSATASAKLHVTATTEQLRVGYDAGNYASFTTSSGGDLTIAPSGSDLAVTGNVDVSGTLTAGTADAFQIASTGDLTTSNAGTWTFSNDTNIAITGGVNGLSIDGTTFSVDGASDRVGIGTAAPIVKLQVAGTALIQPDTTWSSGDTSILQFSDDGSNFIQTYFTPAANSGSVQIRGYSGVDLTTTSGVVLHSTQGAMTNIGSNNDADALLEVNGNRTVAAWGLNGIQLQASASTFTDSSTAVSGTATNAVFNSFAVPTLAASNATVTTTNAATVYIAGAPTNGTNQTITNAYSLWVDAGTARFDGDVTISGTCTGCGGSTFSGEVDDATNDALTFTSDDASAPAGTVNSIFRDNTGDLNINTISGKTLNLQIAGTDEYNFSSSGLEFNSNNITGLGTGLTATAGLTITSTSANLALATSGSGDITATTAGTSGLFNVLTGNLKVGAGTPGLTLNGDDAYITGTFEVDGATQFDGALTFNSTAGFNGVSTFNTDVDFTLAGTENLTLTNTTGSNAVDLFALTLTNNDGGATTQRGLVLTNANSTSTTESLVFLDNADTTASSLTDGILITSSGVNDGIVDAIDVSASNITNALNVGANTITGAGYLVTSTASGLTLNSTNAALAFQTTTAGDITFSPATAESVQITSTITSGTGTSSGLSVASSTVTSGSLVDIAANGTGAVTNRKALNVSTTGAITGTVTTYGGYFSNTHSGGTSTNVGLYATATGGTNNYAAIFEAGNVGIGTTAPTSMLHIQQSADSTNITTPVGLEINSVGAAGELTASSGNQTFVRIAPTVNQTSTASYSALDVNVTETAVTSASGLNRLADFRVGGSSKVAIANDGTLTLQNASNLVSPYASIGAFQNHLVRSEEFDNASWTKTNVTAPTANTQVAPDGSTTAESLVSTVSGGYAQQATSTAISAVDHTFSVWVRSASGTQAFDLELDGTTGGTAIVQNHTATTSWQRFSVTGTVSGGTGNVQVRIYPGGTGSTGTIYAAKAQLEVSSRANAYALTTSGALTNTGRGESIVSNFATQSGFTYGGRHITNLEGAISASSTTVGQLIRVNDNATGTDDTATVRGLEVQSYSGTNINGVNTAIAGFGYTFGVHAVSTGQANESAQPAALFADLDNGSAPTQGNAIRAYSNNLTSADLVSFYQETTAFTGNGLEMNFGNNSGSFSGNFISLQKAGTQSFHVDDDGSTFVSFTGTGTAHAVCHATNGNTNDDELVDCTSGPSADYAEMYPVDSGIEAGELVAVGTEMVNTYDALANGDGVDWNKVKGQITRLQKSTTGYQKNLIGIVSDNYADFSSTGYNIKPQDNPKSIALKGRVNVKVTNENGAIKAGDYITSSSIYDGYGAKATRSGQVVGQALADFDEATGVVMVYVQTGYQSIGNTIVLDAPSANGINLQSGSSNPLTNTASTFVIQQQTSGGENAEANILQLQTGDANRFMVSSTGSTSILSNLNCETDADSCPSVLKVTQADTELMNIDARGTLTLAGTIVIKDDTFAGSVATDEDGLVEITFSYQLGTGKPVVQLTAEAQIPVFAQIVEFKQDDNGNYTGFIMKTFDLISGPIQAIVHYNVVGKQAGYITLGEAVVPDEELEFYNGDSDSDDGVGLVIDGGEVVGNEGDSGNTSGPTEDNNGSVSGDFTPNNPDDTISTDEGSSSEPVSE